MIKIERRIGGWDWIVDANGVRIDDGGGGKRLWKYVIASPDIGQIGQFAIMSPRLAKIALDLWDEYTTEVERQNINRKNTLMSAENVQIVTNYMRSAIDRAHDNDGFIETLACALLRNLQRSNWG